MKKIQITMMSALSLVAIAVCFILGQSKMKSSIIIESNIEALSNDNDNGGNVQGYTKNTLYLHIADGDIYGYCGEITTGNENFTICSDWMKTTSKSKFDCCYTKNQ